MAKMLVSPSNMLLLDEPTNHLDLRAKDVLLDAIRNFSGTVLFVSHDRYFIDGLATRVFEVEERRVHIYPGNYEDYLWRKGGGPAKVVVSLAQHSVVGSATERATPDDAVEKKPVEVKKEPVKRLNPIKLKELEQRVQFAEDEVPRIEERLAAVEAEMGVFTNAAEAQRLSGEAEALRARQMELLREWEEMSGQLEEQKLA